MPGFALRARQRQEECHWEHEEDWGDPKAAVLANAAAWIAAAWPGTVPDNRHSRRVALLKRILPAIGLALLLLIAVWPRLAPLWERMRMTFPAIDLREARQLRMVNPHYAGVDRLGRPFVVTAAIGRQVPDRQDLMSLEAPRADMKMHAGADVVVTAATGIYQAPVQLLDLFGEVTLVHQNGTRFRTDTARVDVANGTAEGGDPVVGEGPSGNVKAAGFQILGKGDTIIFTGKSDMLLRGAAPGTEKRPPAVLPTPIAAIATRVEAEAKPALAAALPAPAARHPAVRRTATARTAPGHTDNRHAHPAHRPLPAKPAADKKA
jgi:lipopolysaccharide export system protein LptC